MILTKHLNILHIKENNLSEYFYVEVYLAACEFRIP